MEINLRVLLDWKLYGHKKSVFLQLFQIVDDVTCKKLSLLFFLFGEIVCCHFLFCATGE